MRLIKCHIENFGKISDFDYEFENGCNIICKNNGWGKSTLMAFIRVMLYGFANEAKRSEFENERKRFKPWQGGVYGGSLIFEANGKKYLCHRIFGDKEKDDKFELRDAESFLEVNDFSDRLGEELFQIDMDSFCRSVCITQLNSDIQFVKPTGAINAKLGNLIEDTEDINNFEKVNKRFSDILNAMSPQRKTGLLYRQKEEIAELNFGIKQKSEIEKTVSELKIKRQQETVRKKDMENELSQVNEKQHRLILLEKIKRYNELKKDYEEKKDDYESQRRRFPKELPDLAELKNKTETAAAMAETAYAMRIYNLDEDEEKKLSEYEMRFHGVDGLPKQDEIDNIKSLIQTLNENNRRLAKQQLSEKDERKFLAYKERFSFGELPSEEETDGKIYAWEVRNRKKEALDLKEEKLALKKKSAQQEKREKGIKALKRRCMGIALLVFGVILMSVGIFMLIVGNGRGETETKSASLQSMRQSAELNPRQQSQQPYLSLSKMHSGGYPAAGAAFTICGVLLVVFSAAHILAEHKKKEKWEKVFLQTEKDIAEAEREIKEDKLFVRETERDMAKYFDEFGILWNEDRVFSGLHTLKNDICEYQALLRQEELFEQEKEKCQNDKLRREITEFLGKYYDVKFKKSAVADVGSADFSSAALSEDGYTELFQRLSDGGGYSELLQRLSDGDGYTELLQRLSDDVKAYLQILEKQKNYFEKAAAYKKQSEELEKFFNEFLSPDDFDDLAQSASQLQNTEKNYLHAKLIEMQENLNICTEKENAFKSSLRALRRYESEEETDINEGLKADDLKIEESADELFARQKNLSEQINSAQSSIHTYDVQLDDYGKILDEINEKEAALEELEAAYSANVKKYKNLTATLKYLNLAKESLTEKYMEPLTEGFKNYYGLLAGESASKFRLDANANLTVDEQGFPRKPEFLSTGYRDLLGLCMRMAFIDAMYKENPPFILLDDPFVNYDNIKFEGGMKFLKEVSKKYQVIYFTCRNAL